jgi:hypothetical protein
VFGSRFPMFCSSGPTDVEAKKRRRNVFHLSVGVCTRSSWSMARQSCRLR